MTTSTEPVQFADAGLERPGSGRWPRIRTGPREPIHPFVRRTVFQRDGGRCMACGISLTIQTAQLDHIVPWSAGGSDRSGNLRLLCEPCNTDRSNFRGELDIQAARRVPVCASCVSCWHLDLRGNEVGEPFPADPEMVVAFCGWCGLVSRTWPEETY